MSDAYPDTFTIDALLPDLEAVADAVSPDDPIAVWGPGRLGPLAVAYAARHPERVAKLVLWSTGPGRRRHGHRLDAGASPSSVDVDWDLAMESVTAGGRELRGCPEPRVSSPRCTARSRPCRSRHLPSVRDGLPDVGCHGSAARRPCPTLVMHPERQSIHPGDRTRRRLAAGIAGARLQLIDTRSSLMQPRGAAASAASSCSVIRSADALASGRRRACSLSCSSTS